MKVFSVATDRVAFLSSLEDSARRFGYDLHVLGRDQKWQGFLWRWTLVLDAVEALDPDEVVSVVDGYDVVLAGPAELLEKLYHSAVPTGDALVFGQEHRQESRCQVPPSPVLLLRQAHFGAAEKNMKSSGGEQQELVLRLAGRTEQPVQRQPHAQPNFSGTAQFDGVAPATDAPIAAAAGGLCTPEGGRRVLWAREVAW